MVVKVSELCKDRTSVCLTNVLELSGWSWLFFLEFLEISEHQRFVKPMSLNSKIVWESIYGWCILWSFSLTSPTSSPPLDFRVGESVIVWYDLLDNQRFLGLNFWWKNRDRRVQYVPLPLPPESEMKPNLKSVVIEIGSGKKGLDVWVSYQLTSDLSEG